MNSNENIDEVIYVSNAGVLVKINDKKILIDGLCNSKLPIYKSTPTNIYEQIINGVSPFHEIDIMLITHKHSDHFDVNSVVQFLDYSPNTVVISTPEVISSIRKHACDIKETNLIALTPKLHYSERIEINGVEIESISMIHEGKEYEHTNNLAFLIEYGVKVLHLGDAAPVRENYESLNLSEHRIDLLIANFPYASIPRARKIIRDYINPNKIFIVHLPHKELDRFGWINAAKRSYKRVEDRFIQTIFLEDIGESIKI